jgi:riboflavin biosynthesis pyrimidine reductase
MPDDRPFIVIQVSTSADCRVAIGPNRTWWDDLADPRCKPPPDGQPDPGGELWKQVRDYIEATRHPQADMQGSGSFCKEGEPLSPLPAYDTDPAPLYADFLPAEVMSRPQPHFWLLVVDGRGRLRSGYKGNETPTNHMMHLTSRAAPPEYLAFLQRERIPYLVLGERQVDLPLAMRRLKTDFGVNCLFSTAGGKLNGALLRHGLVDELNLILRPELIGGSATPSLFDGTDLRPDEWPTKLALLSATVRPEGYLWLRYRIASA